MSEGFRFVPPGSVATPEPGLVYVDVGNRLEPGVLDHHQGDAPGTCTARLALDHPEYARAQLLPVGTEPQITFVTHQFPDLDAISAIHILRALLAGVPPSEALRRWSDYVCEVDAGHTRLRPEAAATPYSLFVVRTTRARRDAGEDPQAASLAMLEAGLGLVETFLRRGVTGEDADSLDRLLALEELRTDVQAIEADHAAYLADIGRAESFPCTLPRRDGTATETVPGLWIEFPGALLFKAWARGDRQRSGADGFVFTAVRGAENRYILSVDPASPVSLAGLGDRLESLEEAKRQRTGPPRPGPVRPGYRSADPWYDGRAPLHAFTIVDSPRAGTALTAAEVRQVVRAFCGQTPKR